MSIDYSKEAVQEAEIYAKLPDIPNADRLAPTKTLSHWFIDIKPTDKATLPLFIQARDPMAQAAGLDPDDFVDIVWSCPRLLRRRGFSSWPSSLLLGNQKPPILYPTQTMLFIKTISTLGSEWNKTIETGQPHLEVAVAHTKPGFVHFRDIVIYRLMKQALLESGLQMRILPDPNELRQAQLTGAPGPQVKALSYCANPKCMSLGMNPINCSACLVRAVSLLWYLIIH